MAEVIKGRREGASVIPSAMKRLFKPIEKDAPSKKKPNLSSSPSAEAEDVKEKGEPTKFLTWNANNLLLCVKNDWTDFTNLVQNSNPIQTRRSRTLFSAAAAMNAGGLDSDGRSFPTADEMWREEIGLGITDDETQRRLWYSNAISYWSSVEPSVDGVLGGYGHVSDTDVTGSLSFLRTLIPGRSGDFPLVALDCGSGIGRVTKNLLLKHFDEVDLVEPVLCLLDAACKGLGNEKAVSFFCVPLQEFTPEVGRYDVIWVQWCIRQLADDNFVSFLRKRRPAVLATLNSVTTL